MDPKEAATNGQINLEINRKGDFKNSQTIPERSTRSDTNVGNKPYSISTSKSSTPITNVEQEIINKIVSRYGTKVEVVYIKPSRMKLTVQPEDILNVAAFIKENIGFDHAESVSGTDYPKENQIEVVYHLGSYTIIDLIPKILSLSTRTNRDQPRIPSLVSVFRSVEYHERETYEMVGVYFDGHPRMERFLLPEDWADIPPLRKDFRIKGR